MACQVVEADLDSILHSYQLGRQLRFVMCQGIVTSLNIAGAWYRTAAGCRVDQSWINASWASLWVRCPIMVRGIRDPSPFIQGRKSHRGTGDVESRKSKDSVQIPIRLEAPRACLGIRWPTLLGGICGPWLPFRGLRASIGASHVDEADPREYRLGRLPFGDLLGGVREPFYAIIDGVAEEAGADHDGHHQESAGSW
jgi:hypothetical protein